MKVVPVVHWVTASGGWSVAVAVDLRGPETTVPVAAGWYLGSLVLFPSARPRLRNVDHILTGRSIESPLIRSILLRQIFVIHAESTRSEYVAA
ncbi:hypothetical protein BGW80DRAFT_1317047 [Lactifluus volemus]|nr:hypothetical protein BGW80DRAFT_1317047 [Lactifluus volemus]